MALTQISTAGVKDDAVTSGKIPANAVGSSELADNAVDTAAIADDAVNSAKIADGAINSGSMLSDNLIQEGKIQNSAVSTAKIADDAVTADKLANSINTEIAANTAKTTNATHSGEVTGATALTIADNVVDEANLKVSNSPTNGYFLSAQSGNTGGLTWAQVTTDLVGDTSPQLGGDLQTNGNDIDFADDDKAVFGAGNDMELRHESSSSDSFIMHQNENGHLRILSGVNGNGGIKLMNRTNNESYIECNSDAGVELYHDNSKKFETNNEGVRISGFLEMLDNQRIQLGDGDDLQIYSSGTMGHIKAANDDLRIETSRLTVLNRAANETLIDAYQDGSVQLYHNGTQRFTTDSSGVSIVQGGDKIRWPASSGAGPEIFNAGSSSRDLDINIDNEHRYRLHQNGILYQKGANSSNGGAYSTVQPSYPVRAWLSFNDEDNITNGHGGISSVSDTGTGTFTINFSTSFPDDNYVMVATSGGAGGSRGDDTCITHGVTNPGTGSLGIRCRKFTDNNFTNSESAMFLFLR